MLFLPWGYIKQALNYLWIEMGLFLCFRFNFNGGKDTLKTPKTVLIHQFILKGTVISKAGIIT